MIRTESVLEAAARLGCSRARVFELLKLGVLERATRWGRALRILSDSVDRALLAPLPGKRRRKRRTSPGEIPIPRLENIPL